MRPTSTRSSRITAASSGAGPWRSRCREASTTSRSCCRSATAQRIGVVPHGGNTSYCGGATPDGSGAQLVLSLRRLDRIRSIDPLNCSMVAEAGCILANVQQAAEAADRFFPLSLGAEGSCQIGGNLSTNAGGLNVLRYGMTRDLVLGLEVVLADGRRAVDALRRFARTTPATT